MLNIIGIVSELKTIGAARRPGARIQTDRHLDTSILPAHRDVTILKNDEGSRTQNGHVSGRLLIITIGIESFIFR